MTFRALLLDRAYTQLAETTPRKTREAFPMATTKNANIRVFKRSIVPQILLRLRAEKGIEAFSNKWGYLFGKANPDRVTTDMARMRPRLSMDPKNMSEGMPTRAATQIR